MKISLKDMIFYGFHGTQLEEKKLGQRFIVNFSYETDSKNDKDIKTIEDTIDYRLIYNEIKDIMESEIFDLLESCANMIITKIMDKHPTIKKIKVNILKPAVPIQGVLSGAELEMERER